MDKGGGRNGSEHGHGCQKAGSRAAIPWILERWLNEGFVAQVTGQDMRTSLVEASTMTEVPHTSLVTGVISGGSHRLCLQEKAVWDQAYYEVGSSTHE